MIKFTIAGVVCVAVFFLVIWLVHTIKAIKDPDVQAASKLRMSITRYRQYKKLYDAHWEVMMKYGPNSGEAERFFAKEVHPNLPNLNEWRRYEEYRGWLQRKEQEEEIRKMFSR